MNYWEDVGAAGVDTESSTLLSQEDWRRGFSYRIKKKKGSGDGWGRTRRRRTRVDSQARCGWLQKAAHHEAIMKSHQWKDRETRPRNDKKKNLKKIEVSNGGGPL